MVVADLFVLPVGCVLCGLLSASAAALRVLPGLARVVEAMGQIRAPLGIATAVAGLLALFFPAHGPPLLGSLIPAATGVAVGLSLCLDLLLDLPLVRRYRRSLATLGNALIYVRTPLGIVSVALGILHGLAPSTPFF